MPILSRDQLLTQKRVFKQDIVGRDWGGGLHFTSQVELLNELFLLFVCHIIILLPEKTTERSWPRLSSAQMPLASTWFLAFYQFSGFLPFLQNQCLLFFTANSSVLSRGFALTSIPLDLVFLAPRLVLSLLFSNLCATSELLHWPALPLTLLLPMPPS